MRLHPSLLVRRKITGGAARSASSFFRSRDHWTRIDSPTISSLLTFRLVTPITGRATGIGFWISRGSIKGRIIFSGSEILTGSTSSGSVTSLSQLLLRRWLANRDAAAIIRSSFRQVRDRCFRSPDQMELSVASSVVCARFNSNNRPKISTSRINTGTGNRLLLIIWLVLLCGFSRRLIICFFVVWFSKTRLSVTLSRPWQALRGRAIINVLWFFTRFCYPATKSLKVCNNFRYRFLPTTTGSAHSWCTQIS